MRPQFGTGRWVDYLGDDPAEDATCAAYGPNYDRLTKMKRHYDPDKLFNLNHHVGAVARRSGGRKHARPTVS